MRESYRDFFVLMSTTSAWSCLLLASTAAKLLVRMEFSSLNLDCSSLVAFFVSKSFLCSRSSRSASMCAFNDWYSFSKWPTREMTCCSCEWSVGERRLQSMAVVKWWGSVLCWSLPLSCLVVLLMGR